MIKTFCDVCGEEVHERLGLRVIRRRLAWDDGAVVHEACLSSLLRVWEKEAAP